MEEKRRPKPHSQIIKDIEKGIKELEKMVADGDRMTQKHRFYTWMKKRQNPEMWEAREQAKEQLKKRIISEKERKRILEIELEEFGRIRREEAIEKLINQFPEKDPDEIRQHVIKGWKERKQV